MIGDIWYDFAGARPSVAELKAAGVTGVMRYLVPPANVSSSAQWKAITPAEFKTYIDGGIDVWLNYEWYESRCMEGAPAGQQDGTWAAQLAYSCGYAHGAVIPFSHDQSSGDNATIKAYMQAAQAAMDAQPGGYRVDMYGPAQFVNAQVQDTSSPPTHGWQPGAWSGKVWQGVAHVYQDSYGTYGTPAIAETDYNRVMKDGPFGTHLQTLSGGTTPTVPSLTEVEMFLLSAPGGMYLVSGGYYKGLDGEEYAQVVSVPGIQTLDCQGNQRMVDVVLAACSQGIITAPPAQGEEVNAVLIGTDGSANPGDKGEAVYLQIISEHKYYWVESGEESAYLQALGIPYHGGQAAVVLKDWEYCGPASELTHTNS